MKTNRNEEDFDALRKLLALKRHEQPPPGYFNALPGRISARLASEPVTPFWKTLFPRFQWQPALGFGASVAIFAALFFTAHHTLQTGSDLEPVVAGNHSSPTAPLVPGPLDETFLARNLPAGGTNADGTNQSGELPSLFDGHGLRIERATFPGNGR